MKHLLLRNAFTLKALLFVSMIVGAVSGAWAEDVTSTLTFAAKCNGSGIADDGVTWTVSSDGTESNYESTRGIHYGTSSAQVQYIKLSTSEIEGTITKVVVNASTASGVSATVGVSVGDEAFGGAAKTLSTTATDYTFEGSAEGEIIVTVTKPSQAAKALYVKSVAVTYTTGGGSTPIKEDCDLALTDAPIALTFDMYNNSTAQYISYTTSSTGEITAESNAAVSCYADPETKTISVTPFASTNGKPLVITLHQAADENYKAGSVTFTVTVTDSTPEDPSKVTIWSEDFSSFSASDVPTKGTNATYTCTNGGSDTKIYEEARAGGTSPELLVSKNNGVFSVVITDLKGCDGEMSLSFITNRTDLVVTIKPDKSWGTTTSGTIKSGTTSTLTFDIPSGTKKLTIDFSMTNSSNARLDDIVLIGKSDGKEDNGLSFSSETASAVIGGESSIFPTLTNPNDLAVTYSSSDEKVAVINEEGVITLVAAGETTITATFAGNDDYKAGSASYVLTVTAANQVATPVIAFGAETFFESTTATITCATEGATILYSTDNGENWQTYSEAIILTETTTIIAKATKEGATDSQVSEAVTATKNSVEENLAALAAKTNGIYYVNLNDVVVTYVNGNNAYMKDASGAILLYKNGHGFTAGQVINGIASVTLTIRNSNPQLTALTGAEGYSVVDGTAPEPTTVAVDEWDTPINTVLGQYLKVTGATITSESSKYYVQLGEEKVQLYGQGDARTISVEDLEATYTIVGFPTMYNTTPELQIFVQPLKEEAGEKKDPELAFSPTVVNTEVGVEPELPTLTAAEGFDGTVEYSSSDETVAQIMDTETGDLRILKGGSTTITATFAGNDNFTKGSASYTLNVSDNRLRTTVSYGPIELDIDDVATLTRLAPVVIDAEDNIVEYSYDGWPTEMSFVIVSDDNSLIGSIDNNTGEIILNKAVGTATLKAQYNYYNVNTNYQPSECTFTITVVDPNAPGGRNNPYSVAEAIDYIGTLGSETSPLSVYVSGIVSTAPTQTPTANGELSYYISDDGAAETQLQVYKGKGVDNAAFTAQTDIQVGDEVTVVGKVKMYKTTPEFDAGNYLVSLKRKQKVFLSFEKQEYTATMGQDFEEPTLSVKDESGADIEGLTITYSFESFGNLPIEINAKTGVVTLKTEGEATVIATFAGNDDYKPATASYKLTVMSNKTASNLAIDEPNSTTLNVGDKIQLGYTSEGDGTITWKSSNEAVMTVDQQGNVTAVAVGKATITATQSETESCLPDEASIELTVEDPNQGECLWLLSEASYSSASADQVTWTSDYATMDVTRAEGGTAANNYLGGTNNYTSSRFYLNSTLTITPAEGYRIASVLFQATTEKYATAFQTSTWTNAEEVVISGEKVVTITPTDGMEAIVATIGGTCGFDKVQVSYVKIGEVVIEPSITLAQYEYNVNAKGGDNVLDVTCTNMPEDPQLAVVFVEADGETEATYDWIAAEINEKGDIAGQIQANTGEARTAYFVVTGVDGDDNVVKSQLITINQAAPAAPSITIEGSIDFAASGESDRKLSFEYESLGDNPTFEICFFDREGNAATYDWVTTATIEDNKVNLSVAANDGEARAAYFKVHAEGTEVYSNLVTISQAAFVADYAKLPFSWDGGASADLKALNGVTTNGLGSDYAESNKPYLVKFDSDNDYIQVKTDSRPGIVTVEVKMLGGANSSKITVQESTDGETFTDVQELAISGKSNDILALETTNAFAEDSRYVRLTFTKGSNVGVGPISIAQYVAPSTEPSIAVKVNNITAKAEGVEGIIDVTYKNITNVAADVQFVDAKGEAATYDWIDAGINEENNVVYVIGENTDTEARTAYMQVYALDDEAQDVYSEIITITQEGYVAPLPAVTYSLATTITSGKHYLITDGTSKVMGAQNSNNRAAVSVTFSEGKFSVTEEDKVAEVVICGPDANGFYTIYESGYLYAASSGSNNLKSAATADANGLWQIDIDAATGEASVIASGSLNRNVMQYNATSSIFSCYASASQKPVYFYERDDEETPVASYTRDVASVKWGTICLPNTATITGAQLYSIAGKDKDEAPSALYLTEVKGTAAAGTPYIFKPTASVINAYYTGEAATEAKAVNGLIGSFTGTPVDPGMYLLSKGEIVLCGEGCSIAENRAYIDMSKVKRLSDGEVTGSEVKLNIGGGEDGISSLDAASEGAVIYDLSGRRVSKTVKGLYIVNGKKVSVK